MIRHALASAATGAASETIGFRVDGLPCPQGSLKAIPYRRRGTGTPAVRVVGDNANLDAWRQNVAKSARVAIAPGRVPYSGAVGVVALFILPRARRRPDAFPTTRPDVDKLARAVLDALTGLVWRDDSQVVCLTAVKRYAAPGEPPHATIEITPVVREG